MYTTTSAYYSRNVNTKHDVRVNIVRRRQQVLETGRAYRFKQRFLSRRGRAGLLRSRIVPFSAQKEYSLCIREKKSNNNLKKNETKRERKPIRIKEAGRFVNNSSRHYIRIIRACYTLGGADERKTTRASYILSSVF